MELHVNVAKAKELSSLGVNQLKSRQLRTEANFAVFKNDFEKQLELKKAAQPRNMNHSGAAANAVNLNKNPDTNHSKIAMGREENKAGEDGADSEKLEAEASKVKENVQNSRPENTKSKKAESKLPDTGLDSEPDEKDDEPDALKALIMLMDTMLNQQDKETVDSSNPEEDLLRIEALLQNEIQNFSSLKNAERTPGLTEEEAAKLLDELRNALENLKASNDKNPGSDASSGSRNDFDLAALRKVMAELGVYKTELIRSEAGLKSPDSRDGLGEDSGPGDEIPELDDISSEAADLKPAKSNAAQDGEVNPAKKAQVTVTEDARPAGQAAEAGPVNEPGAFAFDTPEMAEMEQTIAGEEKLGPAMKTDVFEQVKSFILREGAGADERSEMVIRLKPEELGRLELKIELHNDEVTAKFNVASQAVKEALEANLEDLKMALKDRGFEVSNLAIDVREGSKEGRGSDRENTKRSRSYYKTEAQHEEVNLVYRKSLEATAAESTFEHLA